MQKKGCIFDIQRFCIHDGPGIRTTIFFKGCPLRCPWCSNPESQTSVPEPMWNPQQQCMKTNGSYYSINELMDIILKDNDYYKESGGGVTVSGGEVLLQMEFVAHLLKKCQNYGIHTACETSGFSAPSDFKYLADSVDLLIMDLKHHNDVLHREKTGVDLTPILQNLAFAMNHKENIIVRIPIIPDYNDTPEDADSFGILLNHLGVHFVELLPFHQLGKNKYDFLNRKYEYKNYSSLTKKQLLPYVQIIQRHGIHCTIN